jgi:signal transduction histidine kinase
VLALGLLLTAILASFLLYVVNSKSRELEFHKQLDVQSAKDSLLSLASHQLRTPATGVKQYVGMVLEGYAGDISDEQRTMLHKANESNERQLSIINQILRLSRLETERIILNKASTNIGELVHDVVSEQQHQLQNKRISILVTEDDIHADVDEPYFRMVIENLVSNAAKYSREKANIAIHVSKTDADLILKVTDDGIGIPQEDFDKLFKLFTRLDNEMSLQVGGTGIGLYIDKLIVDLHGGQISVDSEVGKGSTFTVTVPLRVSSGDLVL